MKTKFVERIHLYLSKVNAKFFRKQADKLGMTNTAYLNHLLDKERNACKQSDIK